MIQFSYIRAQITKLKLESFWHKIRVFSQLLPKTFEWSQSFEINKVFSKYMLPIVFLFVPYAIFRCLFFSIWSDDVLSRELRALLVNESIVHEIKAS